MKRASDFNRILLFREATDMRKQINGLAEIVQDTMKESPFSENLFLFCNRRKDIIKAIYFDRAGFCLWTKRLDKNRFPWLKTGGEIKVEITDKDLELLFDGVDVFKRHKKLKYESFS